jgi:hypothetical protein
MTVLAKRELRRNTFFLEKNNQSAGKIRKMGYDCRHDNFNCFR